MDRMDQVMSRLQRLEDEAERWRRTAGRYRAASVLLGLIGLALVGTAMQAQPDVPDVTRTRSLEIVDDQGNVVVTLNSDGHGGRLDLWSVKGRNVLRLAANDRGGDFNLWNSAGHTVAAMFTGEAGGAIGLWNDAGTRQAAIGSSAEGGRLEMLNSEGNPFARFVADGVGGGRFDLMNADQRRIFTAEAGGKVGAALTLADGAGRRRVQMTSDPKSGAISFYNDDDVAVASTGVATPGGGGYLDLANAGGAQIFSTSPGEDGVGELAMGNQRGRPMFTIDMQPDVGATMALFNAKGLRSFVVGSRLEGALLNLYNGREVPIFAAGYATDGLSGAMSIKNARGLPVIFATADETERGVITIYNADGGNPRKLLPLP
jgi:hypothetical protein